MDVDETTPAGGRPHQFARSESGRPIPVRVEMVVEDADGSSYE